VSGLTIVAFVFLTLAFQTEVGPIFDAMRKWLTSNLDWFFILSGNVFVLVCLTLIVTPLGSVRIGGKDADPDYTYFGWFAMLFAAGMGIGLMFFGVLEPVYHMAFHRRLACRHPLMPMAISLKRMSPQPKPWVWLQRSITGGCTPGRSMPLLRFRWPCSPLTKACH
jgi:hypothetical protein